MHAPVAALVFATSLLVTSCGGGGTPASVSVTLGATPALTGYGSAQGDFFSTNEDLFIGDLISSLFGEEGIRGFVSFDLGPIPSGARVLSATLRLTQIAVGNPPYPSLGAILVDQTEYGPVLDPGAYGRSFPSNQGFATLSTDATLGPKSADVTVAVQLDRAELRTQSQFRLRFTVETNGNGVGDQAVFGEADPASNEQPVLIVTYQP